MPCFDSQKVLNGYIQKPKPKPEECGQCGDYEPFNRESKCRKGINTNAHARTRACKQAIAIVELAKRGL